MSALEPVALVLDGYIEDAPAPGPGDESGATAAFRLIHSPTDHAADEMLLPCLVTDPVLARTALDELEEGDLLRVEGLLMLPCATADGVLRLQVEAIEVLSPAPIREIEPDSVERYGPYVIVNGNTDSIGADPVQMWTDAGAWVGIAPGPAAVQDMITAYEARTNDA
ncbi:hypothetical protein QMK19_34930 [Streptomyces sp. H10-C2]|uniref:hypothetical protein n=1 Tax=unclassified Streptomyces TaxID=2593676 RepID=UPI0024BAD9C5|nr:MULTISPECIES: hypothetical protein [unclassified Streptomyces]MDJ0345789.1 hypothetical protein [Streptomyces sp. PH10-H1]MDJ0374679.1 hypothetical protein [Streptomyces sp. H10-C2]